MNVSPIRAAHGGGGRNFASRAGASAFVGIATTIDLKLEIGQASESVTVSAEYTAVVETTRTQVSTTINNKAVSDLPINGRNFLDFTLLTPGVVRDPSRSGDISFGGQRGTADKFTAGEGFFHGSHFAGISRM